MMRSTVHPVLVLSLIALLAACKKDDCDELPAPTPVPNTAGSIEEYGLLDDGNYWIYQRYQVDSVDNITSTYPTLDSVFIAGDTTIEGLVYKQVRRMVGASTGLTRFWRLDGDRLVDSYAGVQFCVDPFDLVLQTDSDGSPSQVVIDWSVLSNTSSVSVAAGNYEAYSMVGQATSYGLPICPEWKYPRRFWVAGIGKIRYYDFFLLGPTGYRYDLVRYHVQ